MSITRIADLKLASITSQKKYFPSPAALEDVQPSLPIFFALPSFIAQPIPDIHIPHTSPAAWEDQVFYFLLLDRFSDGKETGYRDNDGMMVANSGTSLFSLDKAEIFRIIPG